MFERAATIAKSKSGNLRHLMLLASGDARNFYRGASLVGVDIRHQDLRGISFEGCDFSGVVANAHTKVDSVYKAQLVGASLAALHDLGFTLLAQGNLEDASLAFLDLSELAEGELEEAWADKAFRGLASCPPPIIETAFQLPAARRRANAKAARILVKTWLERYGLRLECGPQLLMLASVDGLADEHPRRVIAAWLENNYRQPTIRRVIASMEALGARHLWGGAALWLTSESDFDRVIAVGQLVVAPRDKSFEQAIRDFLSRRSSFDLESNRAHWLAGCLLRSPLGASAFPSLAFGKQPLRAAIYSALSNLRNERELTLLDRTLNQTHARPYKAIANELVRLVANRRTPQVELVAECALALPSSWIWNGLSETAEGWMVAGPSPDYRLRDAQQRFFQLLKKVAREP